MSRLCGNVEEKFLGEGSTLHNSSLAFEKDSDEEKSDGCKNIDKLQEEISPVDDLNFSKEERLSKSQFTGPKGVLNDYKNHQKSKKEKNPAQISSSLQEKNSPIKNEEILILDKEKFLKIVDQDSKNILVIISIHDPKNFGCQRLMKILHTLKKKYPHHRICLFPKDQPENFPEKNEFFSKVFNHPSYNFSNGEIFPSEGLPALLCYFNGDLVGNFVQLEENL
eukprot:Sdes_comp21540_c0_seq1m20155